MTTLHILPLQLDLHADLGIAILCDDPLANLDEMTRILTIDLPRNPRGKQSVRFVVRDPAPHDGFTFHATLQSRAAGKPMTQWHKDGDLSRSPYIPAGTTVEVWATVLALPPGDPSAAKVYRGKRNVSIDTQGGGDLSILRP